MIGAVQPERLRGPDAPEDVAAHRPGARRRRCRRSSARRSSPRRCSRRSAATGGPLRGHPARRRSARCPGRPRPLVARAHGYDSATMIRASAATPAPRRAGHNAAVRPGGVPAVTDQRGRARRWPSTASRVASATARPARRRRSRVAPATSSASSGRPAQGRRHSCAPLGAVGRARADRHADPGHRHVVRPPARDRQLVLPGHGLRVRAHVTDAGRRVPWASRARARRRARGPRTARHRRAGRAAHPSAVRRPAAAHVHGPRAAAPTRRAPARRADVRGRRHAPGTTCSTCSATCNEDGIAVVLTTHDLNGMAAHLPHLVCLNGDVVAEGTLRRCMTPDVLERDLRRSDGGAPAPGDARRRRRLDACSRPAGSAS